MRLLALHNSQRKACSLFLFLHLNSWVQNKNWAWEHMFMFLLFQVLASSLTFSSAKCYCKYFFREGVRCFHGENGSGYSCALLWSSFCVWQTGIRKYSVPLTASLAEQHPGRVISLSSTWSHPVSWVFLFFLFPSTLFLACLFFFFFFFSLKANKKSPYILVSKQISWI